MPRCCHCGETVSRYEMICPSCLHASVEENSADGELSRGERAAGDGPLAPIARFTNAAEAGYFAHELLREAGIPATVTMDESFDALSGYWSTRFVLAVPEELAERAALCLGRMIEHAEPDDMPFDTDFADDAGVRPTQEEWMQRPADVMRPDEEQSGVNWVPIVLTLAAGSVVFWGVRAVNVKPQPQAAAAGERNPADVWDLLSTPERPWVQQLDKGRRELRFDPVRREGVLYEDLDGDGHFETEIRVREFIEQ